MNKNKFTFDDIIGESTELKKVIREGKSISNGISTVLILGESGSGKELLARAIHNHSPRKHKPFVAINCGSIPKNLVESELFGYEGGAFTSSNKNGSLGKFELANGGTIFLDEIGEMPLEIQVTLLRVLQEKVITRIGGKDEIPVDIRIIAATNKNLKEEIKLGKFRSDLYYRLSVLPIKLPPLKDRIGDVPILLDYFLEVKSKSLNKPIPKVSKSLFNKMISYCWPGNIRELENFVENFVSLNGESTAELDLEECHCLTHDNLGNPITTLKTVEGLRDCREENIIPLIILEQLEIKKALIICEGNISLASKKLGISRNALYNKMKRYKINNPN